MGGSVNGQKNEADLMEFRRLSQNVLQWEVKDHKKGRRDPRGSGSDPGRNKETLTSNWTAAANQRVLERFEGLLKLL
ncbi:olfactomedin-like protein 3B, partial [Clarias magur]